MRSARTPWGLALAWTCLLLAFSRAAAAEAPSALEVGIVPFATPRVVLAAYEPLRTHLESRLGRPVRLSSAPDFRSFFTRLERQEYHLAFGPPHLGRLTQQRVGYRPIATYTARLQALLVVAADGPIRGPEDLRGQRVGIIDPMAIGSLWGEEWLRAQGLEPGRDVGIEIAAPTNTAVLAVSRGELAGAFIGSGPMHVLPRELQATVRVLASGDVATHGWFIAAPALSSELDAALLSALLDFGETAAGQRFLEDFRYGEIVPLNADDLGPMEPYARALALALETPP